MQAVDCSYLSLDFFVVRAVTFFGLGVLDFADPWPLRPWSGFAACGNVCSLPRLGWVPVVFRLFPRSPPWFIFSLSLTPGFFSGSTSKQLEGQYLRARGDLRLGQPGLLVRHYYCPRSLRKFCLSSILRLPSGCRQEDFEHLYVMCTQSAGY